MSNFSHRLKELRLEKNLSIQSLAKELKVTDRAIQRWEKEERVPNADTIILIAKYFEVSTDFLLGIIDL